MSEYPKTMYKAQDTKIEKIEVISETKSFVTANINWFGKVQQQRFAKESAGYHPYKVFQTWEEAKKFLISGAEAGVANARFQLQKAHDRLGNIKGLKQQDDE